MNNEMNALSLKNRNKRIRAYIVIIGSIILLIMSIMDLNFNNLSAGPFAGIVGSLLLILAMIASLRKIKKKD